MLISLIVYVTLVPSSETSVFNCCAASSAVSKISLEFTSTTSPAFLPINAEASFNSSKRINVGLASCPSTAASTFNTASASASVKDFNDPKRAAKLSTYFWISSSATFTL